MTNKMNRILNSTLLAAALTSTLVTATTAHAQFTDVNGEQDQEQEAQLVPGNLFIEGSIEDYRRSLLHDSGFRVNGDNLAGEYLVMEDAKTVFKAQAAARKNMPAKLPRGFEPIVKDLAVYIDKIGMAGANDNEAKNGIPNLELAAKITRLAFCFGTDPYGIAAQIKKESTFERKRISGTGAVGFTQMTGVAIDEVNDQLGNRGINGTIMENVPYLRSAAACYLGPGRRFIPMFEAGVIPKGKNVVGNAVLLKRAKAFLRTHIDSDLIYGQITLKVHLARAKKLGLTGKAAYVYAFKAYNGEPRGRAGKYAVDVLTSMKSI